MMRTIDDSSIRMALALAAAGFVTACAPSFGSPTADLGFDTEVEYIEVGRLTAASENVLIPLGPGRSYWFNGSDGSRWASDLALVDPTTQIVIIHKGSAVIDVTGDAQVIRHVSGPRLVKRGWYGRVVEERVSGERNGEVTLEDGRRFEVSSDGRLGRERLPYHVVVSADTTRLFVLGNAQKFEIVRRLPAS